MKNKTINWVVAIAYVFFLAIAVRLNLDGWVTFMSAYILSAISPPLILPKE